MPASMMAENFCTSMRARHGVLAKSTKYQSKKLYWKGCCRFFGGRSDRLEWKLALRLVFARLRSIPPGRDCLPPAQEAASHWRQVAELSTRPQLPIERGLRLHEGGIDHPVHFIQREW